MKLFNPAKLTLTQRILAVALTVLGIFVISFCASVMAVIYMHADDKGMVPKALSLSNQVSQPVITLIPGGKPAAEKPKVAVPKYEI